MCMEKNQQNSVMENGNDMIGMMNATGSVSFNLSYDEKDRLISGQVKFDDLKFNTSTDIRHVVENARLFGGLAKMLLPIAEKVVEKCARPSKEKVERF